MSKVVYSPAAIRDLDDIWDYLAGHDLEAADRLVDRVNSLSNLLARSPSLGTARDDLLPGIRAMSIRGFRYVLFFKATADEVTVVRIMHGHRDLPSAFSGE